MVIPAFWGGVLVTLAVEAVLLVGAAFIYSFEQKDKNEK